MPLGVLEHELNNCLADGDRRSIVDTSAVCDPHKADRLGTLKASCGAPSGVCPWIAQRGACQIARLGPNDESSYSLQRPRLAVSAESANGSKTFRAHNIIQRCLYTGTGAPFFFFLKNPFINNF